MSTQNRTRSIDNPEDYQVTIVVVPEKYPKSNRSDPAPQPDKAPHWLILIAYLAYLRAMRPRPIPETSALRILILTTGLVLVILALVIAGAPEQVAGVVANWPFLP
jgi:hypothetical protein